MKKVKFTHFHAENFGKFQQPIQHELGNRVLISGANGVGKSTIKRMIMYILGTKDENGKEISGIRPHDENGVDIDGLTTVAELTVSVDGNKPVKLRKNFFQKQNRQKEYTGENETQLFIDDVKKQTRKAYDEYIQTIIPNPVCISAQVLLREDTAGRIRLLKPFQKHTNDDVINENPQFEELREKLKANSVEELKKTCRDDIRAKTKQRDAYPARIDEVEKQKVDIDLAELELLKNSLNEQIAENKAKQASVDKRFEEYDKVTEGIMQLQFKLTDLEKEANTELIKQKKELQSQIDEKMSLISNIDINVSRNMREIREYKQDIENAENEKKRVLVEWQKVNEEEFDVQTEFCPTCGKRLTDDEIEDVKKDFEKSKKARLSKINNKGHEINAEIDKLKEMIEVRKKASESELLAKKDYDKEVADLEHQLSTLPQSIDISNREDVKQLKQQIAEKEQAMQKGNSASEIRQQLQDEYESLSLQVAEVVGKINLSVKNDSIDERVAELKKQQLALSQEIADIERELDLLKQFERKKAELLESDVNENFDLVQFRMFEKMVGSDDLRDVCQIFVCGESYDRNLNFSNKILAEIDICRGFQKHYGIVAPILADNMESVDTVRIPKVENQLILFKRTDDEKLKIECLEG